MNRIKNLFLVDDDDIFIFLSKKDIEHSDLVEKITVFNNGLDALNFIKENINNPELLPEIILLDIAMPIMDGWQFLKEYEKINSGIEKTITIYMCTSSISPDDISRTKEISAVSDYLIKPITGEKVIEIMNKL